MMRGFRHLRHFFPPRTYAYMCADSFLLQERVEKAPKVAKAPQQKEVTGYDYRHKQVDGRYKAASG